MVSRFNGLRPLFPKPLQQCDTSCANDSHLHCSHRQPTTSLPNSYHRTDEYIRELAEFTSHDGANKLDPASSIASTSTKSPIQPLSSGASFLSCSGNTPSCGCQELCVCPGCRYLPSTDGVYQGAEMFGICSNPSACIDCLDCTILALPNHVPLEDSQLTEPFDNWFGQTFTIKVPSSSDNTSDDGTFQAWNNIVSPDQLASITSLQPPLHSSQKASAYYPSTTSFDVFPAESTGQVPVPDPPTFNPSEEELSMMLKTIAEFLPPVGTDSSVQQDSDLSAVFFDDTSDPSSASDRH